MKAEEIELATPYYKALWTAHFRACTKNTLDLIWWNAFARPLMSHLKFKILLNKGRRGIPLEKLERISEELRRFVVGVGEDLALAEPSSWIGVDFVNGSLGWTTEYEFDVDPPRLARFNDAIIALGRSEFPPSFSEDTSLHFFNLTNFLEANESAAISIFSEDGRDTTFDLNEKTAQLALSVDVARYREAVGAVQGRIHALHKNSRPLPYFTLRELSTGNLVKCIYTPEDYQGVLKALQIPDQVVHVRGIVVTDSRKRSIDHVSVKNILLAEPYSYVDVDRFLNDPSKIQ